MPKQHYACVFAKWGDDVILVRKNHPEWQNGRLNGIGGACNEDELPLDTARREFEEETTVGAPDDLREFCTLEDSEVIVHFYSGTLPDTGDMASMIPELNDAGEPLVWCEIDYHDWTDETDVIDNLSWLVPMAFHDRFHMMASVSAYRRDENGDPVV